MIQEIFFSRPIGLNVSRDLNLPDKTEGYPRIYPSNTPQFLNPTSNTENSAFKIGDVWLSQHLFKYIF